MWPVRCDDVKCMGMAVGALVPCHALLCASITLHTAPKLLEARVDERCGSTSERTVLGESEASASIAHPAHGTAGRVFNAHHASIDGVERGLAADVISVLVDAHRSRRLLLLL